MEIKDFNPLHKFIKIKNHLKSVKKNLFQNDKNISRKKKYKIRKRKKVKINSKRPSERERYSRRRENKSITKQINQIL